MALLGARVQAADTDPSAVAATSANVAANAMDDRVRITEGGPHDLDGPIPTRRRVVTDFDSRQS